MRKLVYASLFVAVMAFVSCGQEKKVEADKSATTKEVEQVEPAAEAEHDHSEDMAEAVYQCPMKCEGEKTYAEAGSCPVCKMDLKEIASSEVTEAEPSEE